MQRQIEDLLGEIGVTVNGNKPYDVKIHDPRLYNKILLKQSVGAGEGYVEGMWDCDQLDELYYRICRHKSYNKIYSKSKAFFVTLRNSIFNQQTPEKSEKVAKVHYNLGNTLYERMLGKSMAYTCGYWKNAKDLDEAQFAKYELICQKLDLRPGERVLELGCGWGGLAKYMAEKYGCEVVAFDIGKEPYTYAKELCQDLPVQVYQCDWRAVNVYNPTRIKFDKLVSVGVLEHVGYKNYDLFLKISRDFIKDDGIFLLHSIGGNMSRNYCDAWINQYIFPNGHLPSLKQLGKAYENKFIIEDFHNIGPYYENTLLGWHKNLNDHWDELKNHYDEKFHRMMNFYLLTCAGGFRAREMQLWQFVLTPHGIEKGYKSIR